MNKKTKEFPPAREVVVLYHADCSDGFGAAWAAYKKFKDKAKYIAVPPGNRELPSAARGKHIYTLDCSFPADVIVSIKKKVASLTIVDHHVSNELALQYADDVLYSTSNSGAVLAWRYFHGRVRIPKLLRYIEDYDLWKFRFSHTKKIIEALSLYDANFKVWNTLVKDFDSGRIKKYLLQGEVLMRRMIRRVGRLVAHAEEIRLEGYVCGMVNSPFYVSEIGHQLVRRGYSFGVIWSRRGKKVVVSLRSDGKIDVSKIAEKYGGGGHPAAAGFTFEKEELLKFHRAARKRRR